jgi:hypothetical protein
MLPSICFYKLDYRQYFQNAWILKKLILKLKYPNVNKKEINDDILIIRYIMYTVVYLIDKHVY